MIGFQACSSVTYEKKPLKYQVLITNPDYKGKLINQVINKESRIVTEYDFNNPQFRLLANKLFISCRMGNKLYYICPDRPGVCRRTTNCLKWKRKIFKKHCVEYEVLYLDGINDFDLLNEGQLECSSYTE